VPIAVRDRVARLLPDDVVADIATRLYLRLDWARTRAMAVPGENKGYIRMNLRGRERHGIVDADAVSELTEVIARGLITFTDPDGSPSISRVERMSQLTDWGSQVASLPDLVVHWGDRPEFASRACNPPCMARSCGTASAVDDRGITWTMRGPSSCRAPRACATSGVRRASPISARRPAPCRARTSMD
jgi:hypothetical protein